MKRHIFRAAAVAVLAAALTALPFTANASTYPPAGAATVSSSTVTPGGTVTFQVADDVFEPGEPVTVTLTGENANGASLAFVKFAVETKTLGTLPANAQGGLDPISIRFPANASGAYTITAISPSAGGGVTATVSVGTAAGGGTGTLPATGSDSASLLGVWVGGGALLLAGGALAVVAAVRRNSRARVTA